MGNSNTKIFDERIWSDKIVFNSKTSFIRKIYKLDDKYDIIINGNENLICKSFTNIPKGIINDESYIEDYPEAIAIEVPIGIYENSNIDTSNTNTIANEISNDIYVKRIKFIPDIVTIRTRFLNDLYDELKIKISTIKISNFIQPSELITLEEIKNPNLKFRIYPSLEIIKTEYCTIYSGRRFRPNFKVINCK